MNCRPTSSPNAAPEKQAPRVAILAETGLAALVVASVGWVVWRFEHLRRLPHPFQSDPSQSLMDLYNTAYWAHHPGAYAVWHTVYPPLSFVLLRLWTSASCYRQSAVFARTCDPGAVLPIGGFYVLIIALVYIAFRKIQPGTAAQRTIALAAGLPMLYGLELGNLIIPSFAFFVLAEGGLVRSPLLRRCCQVVAINFKPYLLLTLLPEAATRRWRGLVVTGLAGLAIYALTVAIEGDGGPIALVKNLIGYAGAQADIYADQNHLAAVAASTHDAWRVLFTGWIWLGQLGVIACYAVASAAPARVSANRLLGLTLAAVSTTAALKTQGYSADYTQIFLLFVIMKEAWRGWLGGVILGCAYTLCLSADFTVYPAYRAVAQSYLGHGAVLTEFGPSIGQFLRPVALLTLQYCLLSVAYQEARRPSHRDSRARWRSIMRANLPRLERRNTH